MSYWIRLKDTLNVKVFGTGSPAPVPVTEADLPDNVRARLGKPCCCSSAEAQHVTCAGSAEEDPGCVDGCPSHPNVTCQLDGNSQVSYVRGQVVNAEKGDLLLSPGSFNGMIGALLGALDPVQHYTHMGIFIDDGLHVRHATNVRKLDGEAFWRGSIVGIAAPTDGLDQDAVRYGWPGTITQRVEDAWASDSPGDRIGYLVLGLGIGAAANQAAQDEKANHLKIRDPVTNECVYVNALSFDPIVAMESDPSNPGALIPHTYPALVLKPCPILVAQQPWVRPALQAVADVAQTIAGHYRFFAYTESAISLDPAFNGPPMLEGTVRDGCDTKPVTTTVGVQCASFVWTAVQQAITTLGPLVLDEDREDVDFLPPVRGCTPAVAPQPRGDHPDPNNPPRDGLYSYTAEERRKAGGALHAKIRDKVALAVASKKQVVIDALALSPVIQPVVSAFLDALLVTGIGTLAAAGLTAAEVAVLAAIQQIPDTIADQICNSFASDNTTGKDWRNPGTGTAVGPDNVCWFYDGPHLTLQNGGRAGLWGWNVPANYHPGMLKNRPTTVWKVSPGPGVLSGKVTWHGKPLPPDMVATVKVGCVGSTITLEGGTYRIRVPAGLYLVTATAFDPRTTWSLTGEGKGDIPFLGVGNSDIDLQDPDPRFRRIHTLVKSVGTLDESLWGDDSLNYGSEDLHYAYVGPFDGTKKWAGDDADIRTITNQWDIGSHDDGVPVGKLTITVTWTGWDTDDPPHPSNAVLAEFKMEIIEDNDVQASQKWTMWVAEDQTINFDQSIQTDELQPDHFSISLTLTNERMP